MIGLNTFLLQDLFELPDEPRSNISYTDVNEKLITLDLTLIDVNEEEDEHQDLLTDQILDELFDSIIYLMSNDLRDVIEHSHGMEVVNLAPKDIDNPQTVEEENLYQEFRDISNELPISLTLSFTPGAKDLVSSLQNFTIEFKGQLIMEGGYSSYQYKYGSKLRESHKLPLWRLIYCVFYHCYIRAEYQNFKAKQETASKLGKRFPNIPFGNITIPFNDSKSQIEILEYIFKPLLSMNNETIDILKSYSQLLVIEYDATIRGEKYLLSSKLITEVDIFESVLKPNKEAPKIYTENVPLLSLSLYNSANCGEVISRATHHYIDTYSS